MPTCLTVDDLQFAIRWSVRRRTIGITVRPDGTLSVAAPQGLSLHNVEHVVRGKLDWVRRKQAELASRQPTPPPSYHDGTPVAYLGRTYRLSLVEGDGQGRPVRLRGGRLEVQRGGETAAAVAAWYTERGREYLVRRVAHFSPLVGASPSAVVVRDLGRRRWGTCQCRTRVVTLHWQLMRQPPALVDYVIVHELAHLLQPNHQAAFWREVERVLPDWRLRRRRLAAGGRDDGN